jgi:hypothetical protein
MTASLRVGKQNTASLRVGKQNTASLRLGKEPNAMRFTPNNALKVPSRVVRCCRPLHDRNHGIFYQTIDVFRIHSFFLATIIPLSTGSSLQSSSIAQPRQNIHSWWQPRTRHPTSSAAPSRTR